MHHLNIEIKARSNKQEQIKEILERRNADYHGLDHQIDTYFNIPFGRLKLREGTIENYLVHYQRKNQKGPKQSEVTLFTTEPNSSLKEILVKSFGILVVVEKHREIYFIDNVKFHIDNVKDLGTFIEIEAIGLNGNFSKAQLTKQCQFYQELFQIDSKDLVSSSYSDLLIH
tara:strand:+ start:4830 stop:5342 length:513 start_codon:yes stop_codon:yes gene_type:complete